MYRHVLVGLTAALAIVVCFTSLQAQDERGSEPPLPETPAPAGDLQSLRSDIARMEAKLDRLLETVAQNTSDIRGLEEKVETEIVERVNDLDARLEDLREIVDDISIPTPNGPGYIPNLGQLQMNQPFGKVVIRNQMTTPQRVTVNGEEHWVQPMGGTVTLNVRPGVVSTMLPGFEGPKAWNVGPANGYTANIDIVPRRF